MFKVIDLNSEVVHLAQEAGFEAEHGDYFSIAYRTPFAVLMTASNPSWTFGGGIDYTFSQHFPKLCEYKRMKGGGMERIGNLIFSITVDDSIRASKEMITKALAFAIKNTLQGETLLVSGLGTGIGGISPADFIDCLKNVTPE